MASNGQKFNKYSEETISEVLKELQTGNPVYKYLENAIFLLKLLEIGN